MDGDSIIDGGADEVAGWCSAEATAEEPEHGIQHMDVESVMDGRAANATDRSSC